MVQVKEQKEEAERFQQKLKEMEDLKIESFLVQLFHINKVLSMPSLTAVDSSTISRHDGCEETGVCM